MAANKDSIELARCAAQAAADLKAGSGLCIDVSERLIVTELFLVLTASSERQMRAVVNAVERVLYDAGVKRLRREGIVGQSQWLLLDFGDVVIHVFHEDEVGFYALDKLWGDCPFVDLGVDFDEENSPSSLLAYADGVQGDFQ